MLIVSASSWGCELKYFFPLRNVVAFPVSLFVRLWVEIPYGGRKYPIRSSASSWGCELKYHTANYSHQSEVVSLFVRLWVEIDIWADVKTVPPGQPLREAVSWNADVIMVKSTSYVSLFVRLWVEMMTAKGIKITLSVSLFVRLWVEI